MNSSLTIALVYTLLVVLICGLLTACSTVAPWERGNLAKPQMALEPQPLLNQMRGHNYGSRESGGGSAFSSGGGGCGCY